MKTRLVLLSIVRICINEYEFAKKFSEKFKTPEDVKNWIAENEEKQIKQTNSMYGSDVIEEIVYDSKK